MWRMSKSASTPPRSRCLPRRHPRRWARPKNHSKTPNTISPIATRTSASSETRLTAHGAPNLTSEGQSRRRALHPARRSRVHPQRCHAADQRSGKRKPERQSSPRAAAGGAQRKRRLESPPRPLQRNRHCRASGIVSSTIRHPIFTARSWICPPCGFSVVPLSMNLVYNPENSGESRLLGSVVPVLMIFQRSHARIDCAP